MSKLSNAVKNDVVKKADYNKLVTKVDNIDTSGLVKKTDYNTKITEVEGKIPDINNLATKTALSTVENKIPDISSLVKKSDYNTKITEVENNIKMKLETFDLSYFRGKNYFDEDGTRNYLMFQPMYRYFKVNSINNVISYV